MAEVLKTANKGILAEMNRPESINKTPFFLQNGVLLY